MMGLAEALSWIGQLGMQIVIFEVDSKGVVDAINSYVLDISEFGSIIKDCKNIVAGSVGLKE